MKGFLLVGRGPVFAVVAILSAATYAAASHPDILRNYRFIPSRSTLVVNGSSTGAFEEKFHTIGTFGLVTGYEEGQNCTSNACLPTHEPYAQFVDVEAWLLPNSPLTYVLNLDDVLNLSGLDGTFQPGAPNRLYFEGDDGQGRPFHLEATLYGRLIRLVGESGPGCCDINHYYFNALAYLTPYSDFNLDGVVDAGDYVVWRSMVGQSAASLSADGNDDGAIDGGDYDLWRSEFGDVIDFDNLDSAGASSGAIPEPATLALCIAVATMRPIWCGRRVRAAAARGG